MAHFNKSVTTGVDVGFDPETYMVTEGNQRDLRVVVSGSYDIPVEVLLSTTGLSATGNYDTKGDFYLEELFSGEHKVISNIKIASDVFVRF